MVQKYLCKIGLHKYVSLNMPSRYTTTYTDRNYTISHVIWFQQCSCCGKRKLKDNFKKEAFLGSSAPHAGIEYARLGWEVYGRMFLGNGEEIAIPTTPKPTKTKFKVFDGGKNG